MAQPPALSGMAQPPANPNFKAGMKEFLGKIAPSVSA